MRRHTKTDPCPICGGYDSLPRGQGRRCTGFTADDGRMCWCSRGEFADQLTIDPRTSPPTYQHRLEGLCGCGSEHGHAALPAWTPRRKEQTSTLNLWAYDAAYDYRDEHGTLRYQVLRYSQPEKTFRQRVPLVASPEPRNSSHWTWDLKGVERLPYRLPELLEADPHAIVYAPEGEKDVDRLRALGFVATCNSEGAGKWRPALNRYLAARDMVPLQDNDDAGRRHVDHVAAQLQRVARSVRTLMLPNLSPGEDVSDWLDAGGTVEELVRLAAAVPMKLPPKEAPRFMSVGELYAQPDQPTEWQAENLLPIAGTSFIVAKPKVGKSVTGQNLAVATAQGTPFLGRATRKGPVLYLALEEKQAEITRHLRGIGARSEDPLYVYAAAAPQEAMEWLAEAVREYQPVLIIIDTWHRLTRVRDINDYAAVNIAMEPLGSLARESGAHLAFTHHGRKGEGSGGDTVLGSTALFGGVDTLLEMRRSGDRRTIGSIQRYGNNMPESVIEMDAATFRVSLAGTRKEADERAIAAEILTYLQEHDEPVAREIIEEAVEGRTAAKRAALHTLAEGGDVIRAGDGKKGSPYLFSCSLVPAIYGEQENTKTESPRIPRVDVENACSQPRVLPMQSENGWEQETDPPDDSLTCPCGGRWRKLPAGGFRCDACDTLAGYPA
jgi:hypothetical protein